MNPGLCLDSGEFITAAELNRRIEMTRITDREMQTLRNTGDVSEEAADEILELRERIAELEAQLASGQEPDFWFRIRSDGTYEGPVHNDNIEQCRKASGAWTPLYTHPAPTGISQADCLWARNGNTPCTSSPAQQPLSRDEIIDLHEETEPLCSLYTFRGIVASIEAAHSIKEKP